LFLEIDPSTGIAQHVAKQTSDTGPEPVGLPVPPEFREARQEAAAWQNDSYWTRLFERHLRSGDCNAQASIKSQLHHHRA
jgi:hypothetical protein